jgi:hypothetical protein
MLEFTQLKFTISVPRVFLPELNEEDAPINKKKPSELTEGQ